MILAGIQSFGNLIASAVAGILWTLTSAATAFWCAATMMLVAVVILAVPNRDADH